MPQTFDWDNAEEIGIQLAETHPNVDPLTVRFTDLHKWIVELPGFTANAAESAPVHKSSRRGKRENRPLAKHKV